MKNIKNFIIVTFRVLSSFLSAYQIHVLIIFFIYIGVIIWRDPALQASCSSGISEITFYIQSIGSGISGYNYTCTIDDEAGMAGSCSAGLITKKLNKLPSWLKTVILFIISFICLNFMYQNTGLNGGPSEGWHAILLSNLVLVKLFFILGSISSFIMIAYYAITIYLFILFSKNKISVPIYLPQFILDWLKFIQQMSKYENKGLYIEFYFRLILAYLFILLLTLFILSKL